MRSSLRRLEWRSPAERRRWPPIRYAGERSSRLSGADGSIAAHIRKLAPSTIPQRATPPKIPLCSSGRTRMLSPAGLWMRYRVSLHHRPSLPGLRLWIAVRPACDVTEPVAIEQRSDCAEFDVGRQQRSERRTQGIGVAIHLQAGVENFVVNTALVLPGDFMIAEPAPSASRLPHVGADGQNRIETEPGAAHSRLPQVAPDGVREGGGEWRAVRAVGELAAAGPAGEEIQERSAVEAGKAVVAESAAGAIVDHRCGTERINGCGNLGLRRNRISGAGRPFAGVLQDVGPDQLGISGVERLLRPWRGG